MKLSTFDSFKSLRPGVGIKVTSAQLVLLQRRLLEILEDIDEICRRIGVDYQLGGGSCLGAVRHGGFIPWDDDADVNMPRSDYMRFADYVRRSPEYAAKYSLHDPQQTPGFDLAFARLRMRNTVYRTRDDLDADEAGVFVDIFFIENVPNNTIARNLHGCGSLLLGFLYSCRRFVVYRPLYRRILVENSELNTSFLVKSTIGSLLCFASVGWWTRVWDRWNGLCRDCSSKWITVPAGRKHYFGELASRGSMLPSCPRTFERAQLNVPARPEPYLLRLYGDFMRVPDIEEQESHVIFELDLGLGEKA